jgi:fimbrial isopeptide formation D2 family protein/LPXTG-motif cell wall-anchored protein
MKVVGNMTAAPKGDKPSLDKQIKHNESGEWGVVGDNQIGDTVEFRTITKVPNTAGYTKCDYIIHDTMSAGLTSNVTSSADVTIKVNDTTVLTTEYYIVTATGNSFSATVDILQAIADGKMNANDQLYTYYTGVLNADAKVYDEGKQDNVAYLEYSNNPHVDTEKGKTPEKKVYDWTFKMGINKVNENGGQLTGAKFALSKNGTLKVADMNCDAEGIPAATTELIGMVKLSDGVYRVATDGDANVVYVVDAGNPVIKGLDDAVDYYLYETKAPAGYNLLSEPVHFKISAAYNEDGSNYTDVTVTVGAAAASNTLSANVVNKSGSTLPETGGIGTTIFYVLGSLLVVGAGVVLITRKRMGKSEN